MQKLLEMPQRLLNISAGVRFGPLQSRKEARELPLPRGWPHVVTYLVIENDQARSIALIPDCEVKERSRNKACIVHFLRRSGRILH